VAFGRCCELEDPQKTMSAARRRGRCRSGSCAPGHAPLPTRRRRPCLFSSSACAARNAATAISTACCRMRWDSDRRTSSCGWSATLAPGAAAERRYPPSWRLRFMVRRASPMRAPPSAPPPRSTIARSWTKRSAPMAGAARELRRRQRCVGDRDRGLRSYWRPLASG
jgi:hypothetical protein